MIPSSSISAPLTEPVSGLTIPSLPHVIQRIVAACNSEDITYKQLSDMVASDSALAAQTLHYANSAYYSAGYPIERIDRAVAHLGLTSLPALLVINHLRSEFPISGAVTFQEYWRYTASVGAVCGVFFEDEPGITICPIALGALHDIGTLVLLSCLTDEYKQGVLDPMHIRGMQRHDAEFEYLECDAFQLGARILEHWELPSSYVETIRGCSPRERETRQPETDLLSMAIFYIRAQPSLCPPFWINQIPKEWVLEESGSVISKALNNLRDIQKLFA